MTDLDAAADLWPSTFALPAPERVRMEAHADELVRIAARALAKDDPSAAPDAAHATYVAALTVLRRADLSRADLSAVMSFLLTDASLAAAAVRETAAGELEVVPEHARQLNWLIWRNARDGIDRRVAAPEAGDACPVRAH